MPIALFTKINIHNEIDFFLVKKLKIISIEIMGNRSNKTLKDWALFKNISLENALIKSTIINA